VQRRKVAAIGLAIGVTGGTTVGVIESGAFAAGSQQTESPMTL